MAINSVAVFCGSSLGSNPEFISYAAKLGETLAAHGITLIYGGASIGLMGTIADHCLQNGGKVIGVIPSSLKKLEIAHTGLTELIETTDMHQRKITMYQRADAFIALPGGFGTLEEFFEILTWRQLNYHQKNIYIANWLGYFNPLINMLESGEQMGFIKSSDLKLFQVANDLSQLMANFLK